MNSNPSANRTLKDKALDHIDHALGRPAFPLRESYRNYFAVQADSELARSFAASARWVHRNTTPCGMAFYSVTAEGRRALAAHLAGLGIDRVYVVRFDGHERIVPAATPAKARYSYWLDVADALGDMRFFDFARRLSVRRAA